MIGVWSGAIFQADESADVISWHATLWCSMVSHGIRYASKPEGASWGGLLSPYIAMHARSKQPRVQGSRRLSHCGLETALFAMHTRLDGSRLQSLAHAALETACVGRK